MHGGVEPTQTNEPDSKPSSRGLENLAAHLDSAAHFEKPTVVAINQFASDTVDEFKVVHDYCASRGVACATADVFSAGGRGAIDLAEKVVAAASGPAAPFKPLYPLDWATERRDRTDRPDHVRRRWCEHFTGRCRQAP